MSTINSSTRPALRSWPSYVRNLWERREFALFMALGRMEARNASTGLGLLWWVLNPLITGFVYFIVFGVLFGGRRGDPAFLAYLLSGMFAFTYTRQSLVAGAASVVHNAKLLVNIRFPRLILPLSAVLEALVGFSAALVIFYPIVWPLDNTAPSLSIFWLVPAIGLHTLFNIGLAALGARLAVPFRDIDNLMPHVARLWLYLSPIIWPLSFVADRADWVAIAVRLNPMFGILSLYRAALIGREVDVAGVLVALGVTVLLLFVGVVAFVRNEGNMVRYL